MGKTSVSQRWRVIGLADTGMAVRAISARLGIPKSTVGDIIQRHRNRPDDVSDLPRSGRPRKTTPRQNRLLGRMAIRDRFCTSMELKRRWNLRIPISRSLILRRLKELGIRNRRPVRKIVLTDRHKQVNDLNMFFLNNYAIYTFKIH